jgi:TolB-like protein/DNA-binding winged helix-turn-helix (wHTH) protein
VQISFEDFTLDCERREFRANGGVVPVEPQVFDLLVYLIENRDRVVSKDDLVASVWGGRIVSDSTLDSRINGVRKILGDNGKEQRLVRTAARKGVRFVGEVVEKADEDRSASVKSFSVHSPIGGGAEAATVQATAGPPRLSMIVLPFTNFGGGSEQGYFVDGVTESLTTDLSRISGATVIARNTAFAYRGKAVDLRALGRDLNIRYVLEGSVQRSGERMRVNVQLIEAETAAHLWAERFDKPIAELFDMQDEIVARIANQLSAEIVRVEARRSEKAAKPDAIDFWLRGRDWINRGISPASLSEARNCFERALEIDPASVNAILGRVIVDAIETRMGSLLSPSRNLAEAEVLATRALAMEPNNAAGRYCLGLVLLFTRRPEQAIAELERALTLDPNLAFAHAQIGFAKCVLGRPEEAEAHVMEALRLSPRDGSAYVWFDFLCIAKTLMGKHAEALPWGRKASETNRGYPMAHFHYAAALALNGRAADARLEAEAGLELAPSFTIRNYRADTLSDDPRYLAQRERILEGLRIAGAPED